MATTVARLEAILSANTRGFDRDMDRSQRKMQKTGKAAGVMGAAIFAGLAVTAKIGFDELRQSQKVTAQTEAALKSTGRAAHVSAKQIDEFAQSMMKKTGIDDEVIKSGENLLLTFRNVRNEVGKGNDIFTRASKASLDLSVAFHKDLKSSSILVGKALQDPIRGLTALRRVGVQFTEQQTAQIKAMVAAGNQMGAQKLILAELNKETGGSAVAAGKTLEGQMNIVKETFRDLAAEIVRAVLPAFMAVTSAALTASKWLSAHPRLAKILFVALGALATALIAASIAQRLMNLAVLANPYVAATVAVIAFGVAIYVFRDKLMNTFNWIKAHWVLLTSIIAGPIGLAASQIIIHRNTIVSAFQGMLKPITNVVDGIVHEVRRVVHWLEVAVNLIKDLIGWLGKIHVPHLSLPHLPSIPGLSGDGSGPPGAGGGIYSSSAAAEGKAFNVGRQLWDEIGMGEQVGLRVTSGYRPGAITAHGTPSDHGRNPSGAVDMSDGTSGPSAAKAAFFRALIGRREIKQAFYDPLGSIFGGALSSYREGGHTDHVHVAEYDKGGYLRPGWNLAYNGLGRPEPVGGGDVVIPVSIGGEHIATVIFDQLRRKAKVFENRNGRRAL